MRRGRGGARDGRPAAARRRGFGPRGGPQAHGRAGGAEAADACREGGEGGLQPRAPALVRRQPGERGEGAPVGARGEGRAAAPARALRAGVERVRGDGELERPAAVAGARVVGGAGAAGLRGGRGGRGGGGHPGGGGGGGGGGGPAWLPPWPPVPPPVPRLAG